jgi:hypothetical protein
MPSRLLGSTFSSDIPFFQLRAVCGHRCSVFDAAGNRLFGDNYVAVLYGGPSPDDLVLARAGTASMEPVPFIRIYNGQGGYFAQGGEAMIPRYPGGFAWLQVRAWDLRLGQTYDEVASLGLGGYGQSSLFRAQGGDAGSLIPARPLLGLGSFSLVPEPGAWAMLALGAGALFWNCRGRFKGK